MALTRFTRALRALREGDLLPLARQAAQPYVGGLRPLPRGHRLELVCPAVDPAAVDGADTELVERIFASYRAMKADQADADPVYAPSRMWQRQLDTAYAPLAESARTGAIGPMHAFLANFGTWPTYLGVESTTMVREHDQSALTRRYLLRTLFAAQLDAWERFQGADRPLSRLAYPQHGRQVGALIDGVFVGPGSFLNDIYGELLAGLIRDVERPTVLDVGAGYGKLAWFTFRDRDDFAFIDVDLPETLCLAAYWLLKSFPERRAVLYGESGWERLTADADLAFLPSFAVGHVGDASVDLVVNKNSLGEMRPDTASLLVGEMARVTREWLFHLNHDAVPYREGSEVGLLARDYPVPDDLRLLFRWPDLGSLLMRSTSGDAFDIVGYLYQRA